MLIFFALQKRFYIPFYFILPKFRKNLRLFLAIFRGKEKGLFLSFKWYFNIPEKQTSLIMKRSIFTL